MAESSTYQRTWLHERNGETQLWKILIDGKAVPEGFVVRLSEGAYEAHYPHLENVRTYSTLDEAQAALECAPVVLSGEMKVGKPAEAADELIDADTAGELLGISKYRINAMVANGVLAGARAHGKTMVSRESVEQMAEKAIRAAEGGASPDGEASHEKPVRAQPQGKFANAFLEYSSSDGSLRAIVEIDHEDDEATEDGKLFVNWVNEDSESRGRAALLDYRRMRASQTRAAQAGEKPPREMAFEELVALVSPMDEE